ncbi:MAG: MBOAT family protein [Oscillospiraceae bacterium]|jgi:alginate O-acetyltransferase complex protein AlgI|nr:MBOAT family protein [Oscillospiraceae bacterium]
MVFSSAIFLFVFLPVVWLINRFLPRSISNIFLCLASLFFYAWGEPVFVLILIAVVLINYLIALKLKRTKIGKALLILGISLNLSTLFFFKYIDFTLETLNLIPGVDISLLNVLLPIGISFFIFQAISYLVDVYREINTPQKSFVKVLLYISFFPQLMAGPIVYYHDISQQIEDRQVTTEATAHGIRRFIIGLSKKVLIANTLAVAVDAIYALDVNILNMPISWIAAFAYILQLYYDFSGYSDMALGLAQMFGFRFKENFNYPYIASTVQEFWRRWHISLTGWFREYVYIPLGGNRKGEIRTIINKVTVFFLTGLWHGAAWTFVVWGLIHGAILLLEQVIKPTKLLGKRMKWVGNVYTLLAVTFAFVLFRSESFSQALIILGNMMTGSLDIGAHAYLITPMFITAFCLGIVGAMPWIHVIKNRMNGEVMSKTLSVASYAVVFVLLILCMLSLSSGTHNPFIYFRF